MLPWLVLTLTKTNPLASKQLAAKAGRSPVVRIHHLTRGFSNPQPGTPFTLIVETISQTPLAKIYFMFKTNIKLIL